MEITKQNGDMCFNEEFHKYWNVSKPSASFISVTTLIGKFEQPFDEEFWSTYKAIERILDSDTWKQAKKVLLETHKITQNFLDLYDLDKSEIESVQQDILDEWSKTNNESCERGTKIHLNLENSLYKGGKKLTLDKYGLGGVFECRKNYNNFDLENGVYPEYLIHWSSKDGMLNIAGQIDCLVKQGNTIHIIDWKGLPLDTKIPTPSGWTTMGEIQIGDELFDKDGNITKVLHKSNIHNNPCYKIIFDNNDEIIADCDHKWEISFLIKKGKYTQTVMTTQELYNYLQTYIKTSATIPKILNSKPLNLPEQDLLIDPYVLGVWLGDGSKSCGIITQATNSKIWEEIKLRGYEIGENLNHSEEREGVEMRTIFGLRTLLNKLNLLNNKHIPEIYLRASYSQRLDLLRGLMDTDGYYNPKRKRFVMETSQDWQCYDFIQLLSSLGIKSTKFDIVKKLNGKQFHEYSINFSTLELNPFLIRNQEIEFPKIDKCTFRTITEVQPVDIVPTQCIEVDSPTHTFLCTEQHIVTHNTNKEIKLKGGFDVNTKSEIKMKYPLNNIPDCNFQHYTLQLSTYAWMMQQINPNFIIGQLKLVHFDHNDKMTVYDIEYKKDEVIKMLKYYKHKVIKDEQLARIAPLKY